MSVQGEKKVLIGVCVVKCRRCLGKCTCGTAKGPHFKSPQHAEAHRRFVENIFALIG